MSAVDLVIHPSVPTDSFGLTLVEAITTSTPLFSANSGASSKFVDKRRVGSLIPDAPHAALAHVVGKLGRHHSSPAARRWEPAPI